jgi:competence CoiA-like predicted nuclease
MLDEQKINYEYETLRIKYYDTYLKVERTSIPDFYLPDSNTIVEIKSTYTLNVQNMKDRVKRYRELGYKFILMLNKKEVNVDNL